MFPPGSLHPQTGAPPPGRRRQKRFRVGECPGREAGASRGPLRDVPRAVACRGWRRQARGPPPGRPLRPCILSRPRPNLTANRLQMGAFMQGDRDLVILTATSGDTGSAVAHAYHGVQHVQSVVLFPLAEVSNRQRKQMTTLGGNVTTFGVDGKFDDCQAMVKRAFADPDLAGIQLSSANSINIGRLLPQSVYYVYAYVRLANVRSLEPIVFSVPSGNFGDMMGGVLAMRMGVPVSRLVIATNSNDEVPRFFETGAYEKIVPSRVSISNAMNVGHPSNLARLVDAYGGWMDETGTLKEPPDLERLRKEFYSVSISDDETRSTIRSTWERHRAMLEPHGAVGWAGLARYLDTPGAPADSLAVSIETAHPAKFPEEIQSLLGIDPELPPSLAGIESRPETYGRLTVAYEPFRQLLKERFLRA
ncbi:MAG: threonine synthase [Candidatus Riflebacteria bacterium]|nr:threonine synthase [Candidatus Riflebacteria bacterium]